MISMTLEDVVTQIGIKMGELTESQKETDRRIAAAIERMDNSYKNTNELVGNLGGKIGIIIELLLIPGICPLMNQHGHDFVRISPNVKVSKNKIHTQIDLMLYNAKEAMAVEIKNKLDREDVEWHISRLKKMGKMTEEFGIENKMLYGAVAAVTIDERARKYALNEGLYVIEMRENENIPLVAESPKSLREWKSQ